MTGPHHPYGPPPRRRPGRLPPTARSTRPFPEDPAGPGRDGREQDTEYATRYDPRADTRADHRYEPEDDDPGPRKITVTRVAAWRARRLTARGAQAFHRAASADGADRSGLTALTYAWMANYASDATLAVALANTLFFSAASAESKTKVALYLLITVAPFAVVAPVIGPALDRLQQGRRAAMAVSTAGQGVLAVVLALWMDTWALYPAALGIMVLSKSFGVLKAAVTPRVLPPGITLVTTNSRLTVFGLVASGVAGGIGAGVAWLFGSPGAAWLTAGICLAGVWLCLRIPAWVEVTEGEVPTTILPVHGRDGARPRASLTRDVVTALWANGTIRSLTGFLTLFSAFVVKNETEGAPGDQLVLLGLVGAAAGAGGFLGNFIGARQRFDRPRVLLVVCLALALAAVVVAAVLTGIASAAGAALVAATTSALLKVCLDAVVQRDLPEASRASAFGRSETILQLSWVFGGALGVLLPPTWWIGFTVIGVVVAVGTVQTVLITRGRSMLWRARR
ncbi:MFS transporter [Actinomycetospora sp. NBRC 106375]|uniref:MFS transporter n=1 Tax=Actinomycetospora sp. NBRC 106375 TaxID=3032207 RepID=UPI0024A08EF4|nr:MFS transporter [Actinomycetospora sp. NBRC 106375]GLZ45578.1 MFS transporter [Actinomycetospora sp. NBRC 106375]